MQVLASSDCSGLAPLSVDRPVRFVRNKNLKRPIYQRKINKKCAISPQRKNISAFRQ